MQVGDPESEIEKVAQTGIRGMVGAVATETISPHQMIDAALHVLAAWVASSQVTSRVCRRRKRWRRGYEREDDAVAATASENIVDLFTRKPRLRGGGDFERCDRFVFEGCGSSSGTVGGHQL